ncbi:MAG: hypothetical protein IKM61_00290 [Eubacteriaceae bacterium]|nr:hypothetical protein [Eubacteriaceae bacterium]
MKKIKNILCALMSVLVIFSLAACSEKTEAASLAGDVISVKEGMLSFDDVSLGMSFDEAKKVLEGKGYDLVIEDGEITYFPQDYETVAGLPVSAVSFGGMKGDTDNVHIMIVNFVMPEVTHEILKDKDELSRDIKMYFSHGRALYQGWGEYLVTEIGSTPYADGTLDIPGIEINTMAFKDGKVMPLKSRSDVGNKEYDCSLEATFVVDDTFTTKEFIEDPEDGHPLHMAQMQIIMWTTEAYNSIR